MLGEFKNVGHFYSDACLWMDTPNFGSSALETWVTAPFVKCSNIYRSLAARTELSLNKLKQAVQKKSCNAITCPALQHIFLTDAKETLQSLDVLVMCLAYHSVAGLEDHNS